MIFAPKFPLRFKEQKGFEDVTDVKELIRFHLTNLLLTSPGEKISDSEYGIGVRRFLFEQMTSGLVNNIQSDITAAIGLYLSYINLESVEVNPFPEENKITIVIKHNIVDTKEKDVLAIELTGNASSDVSYWGNIDAQKTFNKIY